MAVNVDGARSAVITKLNTSNYSTWKYQMKLVLMEHELWSTVDPGETKPKEEAEIRKYKVRQEKALAKICLAIGDEQQQHVQHLNSPKEVWDELERIYAPRDSRYRIVQLRRQLHSEKLNEHPNIDSYLGKINYLVTELTNVGDKIEDADIAMSILCGLSEDWDNVVSIACNLPETEFTCVNIKHRLLAEAERRNSSTAQGPGAMTISKTQRNEKHQLKSNRPMNRRIEGKGDICYNCGKRGHYAKNCHNKNRSVPQKHKNCMIIEGSEQSSDGRIMTCDTATSTNVDMWIIDSGATHHMSPNREYFTAITHDNTERVTIADGSSMKTEGSGKTEVKILRNRGRLKEFKTENTLYLPRMRHNVLSVTQMIENDKEVLFNKHGCFIYDSNGELLVKAEKEGRLHCIKTQSIPNDGSDRPNLTVAESKNNSLNLWHRRFMHASKEQILKMAKKESVNGLNCQGEEITPCEDCLKGKSTRLPFPKNPQGNVKETAPLTLVHCDLMGPIDTESWGKARYILTITDEATRYVHVIFLRNKGKTLDEFKKWLTQAERQTHRKLMRIRTDNGLEFCSQDWDRFCESQGIIHERTMVYTPQQNGIAERINRTLMNSVRCTISESNLPKASWAELIYTSAYIRNRLTNKANEEKTPFELWHGRKPSVRHLRACGCDVYVHIPKERRKSKLQMRAKKGILVGYALRGRGWRIWLPDEGRIIESRDCRFIERGTPKITDSRALPDVQYFTEPTIDQTVPDPNSEEEDNSTDIPENSREIQRKKSRGTKELVRTHPMKLRGHIDRMEDQILQEVETQFENDSDVTNPNVNTIEHTYEEPTSYSEAISGPDANNWLQAMEEEMQSLLKHNVWELAELPVGTTPVKCKWVLKRKTDIASEVHRYKARLVAKGFTQAKGLDYEECYSPVSSFETIRLLTAIAVRDNYILEQYDVKNAYLHSKLDHETYMEQPEGFIMPGKENLYCKLHKSIYGLKQSGQCWNTFLDNELKNKGFIRNQVDPCVYQLICEEGDAIIAVYVDDIFAVSANPDVSRKLRKILESCFDIRYLGKTSFLLGVEFNRSEDGSITLTQGKYIDMLLKRFGLQDAKGANTPMETRPNFERDSSEQDCKNLPFRELIGALMFLSQRTRPDISFAVNKLAQYSACFNRKHWDSAKRILRYIKSTPNVGLRYEPRGDIIAYADADWASCPDTRKGTSGYVIMLSNAPIIWKSSKQTVTSLSTMEAEYIALSSCARELVWTRRLLELLGKVSIVREPTEIKCDSQAAIAHAKNFIDKTKTKHIEIKFHFIREKIQDKMVKLSYIPTEDNVADLFTKSLNRERHEKLSSFLLRSKLV